MGVRGALEISALLVRRSLLGGGLALAAAAGAVVFNPRTGELAGDRAAQRLVPEQYGAVGDGLTNDTAALQAAMRAAVAAGVPLYLQPGKDYRSTTGLTAAAGLEMIGYDATISTAANITLLTLTTDCVVRGVRFKGPSSVYHANSRGVSFSGTLKGPAVAPRFISGVQLIDCRFEEFGYAAILPRFDDGTRILNPTILNCGYAGILTDGSRNLVGEGGYFDTFTGETGTGWLEAMAISWSCADNEMDHVRYPPSLGCKWTGGLFKNCPTWAVLDTHGGVDCHFEGPRIIDCRRAIWLTSRAGAGPVRCSATNVVAENNFPEGATNSNGTSKRDAAFLISGADAVNLARDCHISGVASRFGSALDVRTRPAATMARTDAACGMDVRLIDPYCVGLTLDTGARGHIRAVIENPQSAGAGGSITSPAYLGITGTGADVIDVTLDIRMIRSKPGLNRYVGVRALVSSGRMENARLNFERLSFDPGIDMGVGTERGTVFGAYPVH